MFSIEAIKAQNKNRKPVPSDTISRKTILFWLKKQVRDLESKSPQWKAGSIHIDGKIAAFERVIEYVKK